jgi:hypothetical protein
MESFKKYILESTISKSDRTLLSDILLRKGAFKKSDGLELTIGGAEVEIVFSTSTVISFPKRYSDLSFSIVELCDALGLEYQSSIKGNEQMFVVQT